jgi:hypothetical protein
VATSVLIRLWWAVATLRAWSTPANMSSSPSNLTMAMHRFISGDGYNRIAVSREIIAALTQKASVIPLLGLLVRGMSLGQDRDVQPDKIMN